MPRGYAYPYRAELWLPLPLDRTSGAPRDLNVTARLRAGVSAAQVDRELGELGRQFARETPANREMAGLVAIPMRTELVGDFRAVLQALVAAVGLVLLIASVNVSNLLLARSTARRREFGIRGALGASRGRQIRQLLTESMLLAAAGGAIGLALTLVGIETLAALIPENMRDVLPAVRIDAAVLAFATLLPLVTGLVFGLMPALRTWSPNLVDALKDGGRGSGAGGLRLLHALVVAEIAVALVLLSGGALLLRDLQRRFAANLGVRTDGVVTMSVAFPEREYAAATARAEFVRQVEERLAALPGVHAAGATTIIPFGSGNTLTSVEIDGRPGDAPPTVNHRLVTPGFFPAMGIRLVRGRLLGPEDDAGSAPVAVVSDALARRYWPGEDPIGKRLRQRGSDHGWRTVVGVVGNVAEREIPESWYLPYAQGAPYMPVSWATLRIVLVVRATGDLAAIVPAMRRAVSETDANVPVFDVATLRRLHVEGLGEQRLSAVLTGSLAALGLVLATLGIYGVVSYAVSRRNREIGIRMAVGADTSMVLRHELSRSGALVLGGLGLGLVATFALTRYIAGLLAEIEPRDPLTLGMVVALLSVVGALAAYIPARRAASVDPLIVLRPE